MQQTENGQQGVILSADVLHALTMSMEAIAVHTGAVRLMLSSLITDGAGDPQSLTIIERTQRMAEEQVDNVYGVLAAYKAIPLDRLAQDLSRRVAALTHAPTEFHPLDPRGQSAKVDA
ncbi:hypothetical protein JET76_23175 [Pseudomonas putida]|uniref:hypothetical protein n=1 Tax=Pseudomonas putida TaxID=303 RepID=UPI0018E67A3D|nr:hypothetical protein [Pseudomonas putida]MBI6944232.1 hypothetical protein [Pseudomonas putida]MBI6960333.1 hypothetical protein [Pseudomonas putida]